MFLLDDETLLETYRESLKLDLDDDFVYLLSKEMNKRSIDLGEQQLLHLI